MNSTKHIFIIGSSDASNADHATINELEAIAAFPVVADELLAIGGAEALSLFALPERLNRPEKQLDTVTWYTDRSGPSVPLSDLPADEGKAAAERLGAILNRLAEAPSPAINSFLRAALNIQSTESIRVIGDQPVIINWGMVPKGAGGDPETYDQHIRATVGPYLPDGIRPEMSLSSPAFPIAGQGKQTTEEGQEPEGQNGAAGAAIGLAAGAGAAAMAIPAEAAEESGTDSGEHEVGQDEPAVNEDDGALPSDVYSTRSSGGSDTADGAASDNTAPGAQAAAAHHQTAETGVLVRPSVTRDAAFVTLAGLAVVLLLFVVYALWPGNLIYPNAVSGARLDNEDVLSAREQVIGTLRDQIAELQGLSGTDICELGPGVLGSGVHVPPVGAGLTSPDAVTPGTGLQGTEPGTPPVPGNGDSTAPGAQPTVPAADGDGPLDNSALLRLLDQATVFVIGPTSDSVSTGSGFFISPRHVVTNYHVVEGVRGNEVFISNGQLPQPLRVRIINHSANSDFGSDDFAVLELAEPVTNIQPLKLASTGERLTPVVAAGYPSFILSSDPNFIASFRDGDMSHLRDINLAVTTGSITAEQQSATGNRLLAHSATISPGNSGGPLADLCGRVIGVNTYTRTDSQNALRLNFALGAQDLKTFLSGSTADVAAEDTVCSTRPAAVAAAPDPAQAEPPQQQEPPDGVPDADTPAISDGAAALPAYEPPSSDTPPAPDTEPGSVAVEAVPPDAPEETGTPQATPDTPDAATPDAAPPADSAEPPAASPDPQAPSDNVEAGQ
ncbi:trypsin-like peptidase domain-containing protein [uncultured Roseibium sp.]|uniref:S1C family serine protease n=1 Tax=uncultured Roseibium sp. TaxID=1936171 RepID=UPI003216E0F5